MKISLKESLDSLAKLYLMAESRMIKGTEKYGEDTPIEPLKELEEEAADLFNYLAMFLVKIRRKEETSD